MSEARSVAVIVDAGRLLVVEQHEPQVKGMAFVFPGSIPKPGEILVDALARVVKEHIGLSVSVNRLLYVGEVLWHQGGQNRQEIGMYFLCRIKGGVETDPEGNVHARDPKMRARLMDMEMIDAQRLYPPFLRKELLRDYRGGFKEGVKHFVDDLRPK